MGYNMLEFNDKNGRRLTVRYGCLCEILSPVTTMRDECVLSDMHGALERKYTTGNPCSEYAICDPESFYDRTGLRLVAARKNVGRTSEQTTPADTPETITREYILDAAKRCVCGDRDNQYGSPEASFEAIADLWGSYLWNKHDLGRKGLGKNFINTEDVAALMVLFKMARVATGQNKSDNWFDAAGYAACGGEIGGNAHG